MTTLAGLPFLEGAAPEVLESIAAALVPESREVGAVVLVKGGPADDLFVVVRGRSMCTPTACRSTP